jgi:hypothetical protein
MTPRILFALPLLLTIATAPTASQAALQPDAGLQATCTGTEDCSLKWARAAQWAAIVTNRPVRVRTGTVIDTGSPVPGDPALVVVIQKVSLGDGSYRFDLQSRCGNMYRCSLPADAAQAAFVRSVMGEAS